MANELAMIQKDITDAVSGKLANLEKTGLSLPANYNPQNALKSAFFKLQEVKDKSGNSALEVCTKDSIANSLLDMVVQGLSPAKTQCYFIVYGTSLQLNRSYFGTQAVLKRLKGIKDIWANVIYQGDDFVMGIDRGREILLKHDTSFENRDNEIIGVYAIVEKEDETQELTVMTRKEIETAWTQSKTSQAVHKKFPQEMAKRTVINRAAKSIVNTSDDSDLLIESINNSTGNEYDGQERKEVTPIEDAVQEEIKQNANQEVIGFSNPATQKRNAPRKEAEPVVIDPMPEPFDHEEIQEALFDDMNPPVDANPGF